MPGIAILAVAPAALPCSYLAGDDPDWLPQSTADHLIHADAVVVGLGADDGTLMEVRCIVGLDGQVSSCRALRSAGMVMVTAWVGTSSRPGKWPFA